MSNNTPCRCHSEETQSHEPIQETVDYAPLGYGPDGAPIRPILSETIRLAALALPHGTKIEFWGNPAENEAGLIETGGSAYFRPTFGTAPNLSLFEMYTRLAPKDVPVPELLLKLADPATQEGVKKKFRFQEVIEEPVVVSDEFDIVMPNATRSSDSGTFPWNCSKGAQDFESIACNGSYPSNAWIWCDPGKHTTPLNRWTSCDHKRKKSLALTAVCNTTIGYVQHYYKNCVSGNWHLAGDWSLSPGGSWTRWDGLSRRARKVRHGVLNTAAGAYFRAFTAVYS